MIVLAVGAHPDDIELGMGATIHKLKGRYTFHGLVLSSGASRGKPTERENATRTAADILGYQPHFGRLPDGFILEHEAAPLIESLISELHAEVIVTHIGNDAHRDHLAAYRAAVSAARHINNILFFGGPYSQSFQSQLLIPLSKDDMDAKVRVLQEHQKALTSSKGYLEPDNIMLRARSIGEQAGFLYAEAFEIGRLVLGSL